MLIKVARNASGFTSEAVRNILRTCQFIFTSNEMMVPVIAALYPDARVLLTRQDRSDEQIRQILLACNLMHPDDELEVVSVLIANEHVDKSELDRIMTCTHSAHDALHDALEALVTTVHDMWDTESMRKYIAREH